MIETESIKHDSQFQICNLKMQKREMKKVDSLPFSIVAILLMVPACVCLLSCVLLDFASSGSTGVYSSSVSGFFWLLWTGAPLESGCTVTVTTDTANDKCNVSFRVSFSVYLHCRFQMTEERWSFYHSSRAHVHRSSCVATEVERLNALLQKKIGQSVLGKVEKVPSRICFRASCFTQVQPVPLRSISPWCATMRQVVFVRRTSSGIRIPPCYTWSEPPSAESWRRS